VSEDAGARSQARLSDEELAARRREAAAQARARHQIYLGMAAGVGKTYAALHELRRRRDAGADAVIGYVETYNRPGTVAALADLEIVPRCTVDHKGLRVEEMDLDLIMLRHPDVVLVDEIAHTNAPGVKHAKRWQDVQELLGAGISVISTLNIQHVESVADIVAAIAGVEVHERIPDHVVDQADEIELIDLSPRALRQRIEHGDVYPRQAAEEALRRYFREGNLTALRELALRKVSTEVERDLETFMREHAVAEVWPAAERVMVGITDQHLAQHLVRSGWHLANRLSADLLVAFVETPSWSSASEEHHRALNDNVRFAEDLGATVVRVEASSVAQGLVQVAREHNVAHLVVGHPRRGRLPELLGRSVAHSLLHLVDDINVHVIALHGRS
jgi:two-component system sensor histidine kinase KdpD